MADAKPAAAPASARISGLGLLGRKVGMTRIFNDDGESVPVTVLEVSNNRVTQIKTVATDGYAAVQVAHGVRKPSRIGKPQAGHFAKAGVEGGSVLREFRLKQSTEAGSTTMEGVELKVGATLGVAGARITSTVLNSSSTWARYQRRNFCARSTSGAGTMAPAIRRSRTAGSKSFGRLRKRSRCRDAPSVVVIT